MIKQKIIKYIGLIGIFFTSIFSYGWAKVATSVSDLSSLDNVQPIYGTQATPWRGFILPVITLLVIVGLFIFAIVLGIRALLRRRK